MRHLSATLLSLAILLATYAFIGWSITGGVVLR